MTLEKQLARIKNDSCYAINTIENPSEEVKLEAVRQTSYYINCIKK